MPAKNKTPYKRFAKEELILRDELAIDRTLLANERTLMAYIRTFIAILAVGATLLHFANHAVSYIVASAFIIISVVVLGFGIKRYLAIKNLIYSSRK